MADGKDRATMATTKLVTAEDLLHMEDDDHRYDLIEGELIRTPLASGGHGGIAMTTGANLWNHVRRESLGTVFAAETGFILARNPDIVLGPDVAFVRADRLPPDYERGGYLQLAPDLAVEVRSPSDRAGYVNTKIAKYLEHGVRLLWLIDSRRRTVTVYTPGHPPRVLTDADELDGGDVLPGFHLPVAAIFR